VKGSSRNGYNVAQGQQNISFSRVNWPGGSGDDT